MLPLSFQEQEEIDMGFIKWVWNDYTLAQKIVVVCIVAALGISVYGVTQHFVWVISLLFYLLVLWWIVVMEWCVYKAKKQMGNLGGKYER